MSEILLFVAQAIAAVYVAGALVYAAFIPQPNTGAWSRLVVSLLWPLWVYDYLHGRTD